jgi:FeS assembly protein IscX
VEIDKIDWTDVFEIAIELADKFPEIDPQWISFPDLHKKLIS